MARSCRILSSLAAARFADARYRSSKLRLSSRCHPFRCPTGAGPLTKRHRHGTKSFDASVVRTTQVTIHPVAFPGATTAFIFFAATPSLFGPLLKNFSHKFQVSLPTAGGVIGLGVESLTVSSISVRVVSLVVGAFALADLAVSASALHFKPRLTGGCSSHQSQG